MGESSPPDRLAGEARETAGITTALLLAYLDAVGGREAVEAVLARCDLQGCEAALRDENTWIAWETKIALFEATVVVLDNPEFLDEMAAMALDLNVAGALKVALRTLGTPEFVYRNIVRANSRFNGSHAMELLELRNGFARVRFSERGDGRRFHPLDCHYNQALLAILPQLFGLPAAHGNHRQCMADGADACIYDLTWTERRSARRSAGQLAGAAVVAGAAALLVAPVALVGVGVVTLAGGAAIAARDLITRRDRLHHLERQSEDDGLVARQLFESLQDLVSELDLDELVRKINRNAARAMAGREFALLVRESDGRLRCRTTSGLPEASTAAIEVWANETDRASRQVLEIDDITAVGSLRGLPFEVDMPLWSLVSAPLISRSEQFGVLVALGNTQHSFLPRDIEIVQSYATQAAIALANAQRYGIEQSLAARDPLTGLLNHRSFHEAVQHELDHCSRGDRHSSLVMIDLDGFKRVNDQDGHAEGDRFLRSAARALSEVCRQEDLAFRIGGDEFALLLPGVDEHAAAGVAERVCGAIAGIDDRTGASCGVAVLRAGASRDQVLALADGRLYEAKRSCATVHDRRRSGEDAVAAVVAVLGAALGAHDAETADHAADVAMLADAVAGRLGLAEQDRRLVRQAAATHDIGKLAVPAGLLTKEGPLTEEEWVVMRAHSERGAAILEAWPAMVPLAEVVRSCHERWDGTGYPRGLAGEEIPLAARVVAVCDAYEAMTTDRPYRAGVPEAAALEELRRCAGRQFDSSVVEAFVAELRTATLA
ncbi:MAG: diguanylate cyclase and metal dependent phosphohydrolase [Solirubrobacterales bacterium]|nr:diguanylate cyclase and metal dependent phosphohydrolase [Solirubrobacterales bacterium]